MSNHPSYPNCFADILDPLTEDDFFETYYDKKPVHIPGGAEKFAGLMNWEILQDLLNMTGIWSSNSLQMVIDRETVPPRTYCEDAVDRDGASVLRPDPARVMNWLERGASLVANDIDMLTGPLRAAANAFEEAYSCKAQANLYCSWPQRQAFESHFDTHDVFAVHVEGKKTWHIYETRAPHPIRHTRFTSVTKEQHRQNRGKILMEVEMSPGDVLYIPRGWYHDALANTEGGTVHIAFGLTSVIGMDFLSALSDLAVNETMFRLNLPPARAGRAALANHIGKLANSLSELSQRGDLVDMMAAYQAEYHYKRGGVSLPVAAQDPEFALVSDQIQLGAHQGSPVLVSNGKATAVPPTVLPFLQWCLEKQQFRRSALIAAFPRADLFDLDKFLNDMANMQVIKPS